MSEGEFNLVMGVAAGDVQFADAVEALVSDAVDDAMREADDGVDAALAGRAAGRRFRSALTSHQAATPRGSRAELIATMPARRPPFDAVKETDRRADAFRRMAGVRV